MLVSNTTPNLISGVSQQPAVLRRNTQAEESINSYPSVVEGLIKRYPTKHITKIDSGNFENAYLHNINRDQNERYQVVVVDGQLQVFDLSGNEYTVDTPYGTSYLSAPNPAEDITMMTIADYTFVVNKRVQVEMDPDTIPERRDEAIIFINQAMYRTTYKVHLEGQTAEHTTRTGEGGEGQDGNELSSQEIAEDLVAQINNLGVGFDAWTNMSTIWIRRATHLTGGDFDLSVEDSRSNSCIRSFSTTIQRFSQLPTYAPDGYVVEVTGESSSEFNNYFVEFEAESTDHTVNSGVWVETAKPGIQYKFRNQTMPHGLIREAGGHFTFRRLGWGERKVGDENSNTAPSFVGRRINDIFFFRNRLGLLSGSNVIMSRVGEFFDFWYQTITALLATDPVDTAAGHNKVSILYHAIPFQESLLCFSDQTQFIMDQNITPQNADLLPITEFQSSISVPPVTTGKYVFFATARGDFGNIKEYFIDEDTKTRDATDITAHVPQYIPKDIYRLVESLNEDLLMVVTKSEPNAVYYYKYHWSGNEKLQSAWGKWVFEGEVLNASFIESRCFLVMRYSDGIYLEYMDVVPGATDQNSPFLYHIDRRVDENSLTLSYNSSTNKTLITFPYPTGPNPVIVSRHVPEGQKVKPFGVIAKVINVSGSDVTVDGNWMGVPVYAGIGYEFRHTTTIPVVKQSKNNAEIPVVGGRLQIKNYSVMYSDTGFFYCEVRPLYGDSKYYYFNGKILGAGNVIIGKTSIQSGTFKIPIMAKNDRFALDLVNDTFLPCKFISTAWEGWWTEKARRI